MLGYSNLYYTDIYIYTVLLLLRRVRPYSTYICKYRCDMNINIRVNFSRSTTFDLQPRLFQAAAVERTTEGPSWGYLKS